jgi:hypothetical protein
MIEKLAPPVPATLPLQEGLDVICAQQDLIRSKLNELIDVVNTLVEAHPKAFEPRRPVSYPPQDPSIPLGSNQWPRGRP